MTSQNNRSFIEHHASNENQGLSSREILENRAKYGENRLPTEKGITIPQIILNQLKSPLVYIILVAAAFSLVLKEYGDFAIIMVVVLADVLLGFFQEYKAQQTYEALKGLLHPTTTVIREGTRQEIELWELVVGDLVVLSAGEKVPGDGRLIEALRLSVDESILTGESEPIVKQACKMCEETTNAEPDDIFCVFMGTTVLTGHGLVQIHSIGINTELGKIASTLKEQAEIETPFQIRLKAFSHTLTKIVLVFTGLILAIGWAMGNDFFDILRTSIILAIAAVPEGLLIAVTVILVLGMRKIMKRQGLVKKLLAVETLGSVSVICSDKTGTLTEGRMRVSKAAFLDESKAIETMVLCNNLEGPVDIALWKYAEEHLSQGPQDMVNQTQRLGEELFSSETKFMITEVAKAIDEHERVFYLKGAPEIILGMCELSDNDKDEILKQIDQWADEGLRLLGLACRKNGSIDVHKGYCWTGLVGMEDPIRHDVVTSIQAARHAGIQVKIITGDYRKTAERVAAIIGLFDKNQESLDGEQIAQMTDEELQQKVRDITVFARIRPQEKYRIVRALQKNGEITAMIGDGVNDAPALKCANIGVVVGTATDVAKETADLILMDNSFSTIVAAVEEGRIIFSNIRKAVAYMLSNSFAEVLTIFVAMVLKWPVPLAIAQILWIHLICDGPSDIVLGFEPKEPGIMDEPPHRQSEQILPRLAYVLIAVISISSAAFALISFNHMYQVHNNIAEGQSIVFASLGLNSMIYIFAYRSLRLPIYKMTKLTENKALIWSVITGILTVFIAFLVPWLRDLLKIVALSVNDWISIIAFAVSLLVVVEISKAVAVRYNHRK